MVIGSERVQSSERTNVVLEHLQLIPGVVGGSLAPKSLFCMCHLPLLCVLLPLECCLP